MTFVYILIAILVFGFLIFIHELGHFLTARLFRVTVNEFSIGMGPKIISKKSEKTGTSYSLRALPVGGFVAMAGEDDDSEDENALGKKPAWQQFIIMVAGSVMNILLGVILTLVLILVTGHLYGTTVTGFADGATSQQYGLTEGDRIVRVGKHSTRTVFDLSYTILHDGGKAVDVTVVRNGETVVLKNVSFPTDGSGRVAYGQRDFYVNEEKFGFFNVIKHTACRSVTTVRMIWESLIDLVRGKYGLKDMSGPVGLTKTIGQAAASRDGGQSLLYLSALIAVNLGVFNLLPFPALDGFRALLVVIEGISGRKINREVQGYINLAGLVLLMILMIAVTCTDVMSLFKK